MALSRSRWQWRPPRCFLGALDGAWAIRARGLGEYLMRHSLLTLVFATAVVLGAQSKNLDIYWIDVEGGASTLYVSPSGESMLVDTGYETDGRDPKRIMAAAQAAGLTKIDYLVISHYHADHAGGLPGVAKMIPIGKV